ncbi:MAG: S8 family serine peptidase [Streptosporangiales bacterium]
MSPLPSRNRRGPTRARGTSGPRTGLVVLGLAALGVWAVLVMVVGQFLSWGTDQLSVAPGEHSPSWVSTLIPAASAGVPAALVWRLVRHGLAAMVARAWTLAAALVALVAPLRLLPLTSSTLATVVLAAVAAVAAFLLSRLAPFREARRGGDGGTLVAVAAAAVGLLPWAYYGALGGIVDTVASALLAVAVGWFAAVLMLPVFRDGSLEWSRARFCWAGGLSCGIVLLILAAGATPPVSGMLAVICVPPVAFACAAGSYGSPRRMPTLAGCAIALFGPLAFVDPEEVTTTLGQFDGVVKYAFLAMLLGTLAGLVASGALAFVARFLRPRAIAAGIALLAVVGVGVLYAVAGQPGLTGDRLFVVLKDQASLSAVARDGELDARRAAVYKRLVAHAERTQRSLRGALDAIGVAYQPYYLVNALEVDAGPELEPWLRSRDDVRAVLDSPRLRPIRQLPPRVRGSEPPPDGPQWNLSMIHADEVWSKLHVRGRGVVVGQSDTGVDADHPALSGSYRGRHGGDDYNWLDPWYHSTSPRDWSGHGTHTLGTAVGSHNIGVAPGATWIGCVNLARNLGDPALYLDCLQFMLAPYPQGGDPLHDGDPARAADVVNNSWGCPAVEGCSTTVLRPAARALTRAGIFVVASAGNTGPTCGTIIDPLARYRRAFAVGAVDSRGDVASFSSRGPVPGTGRTKPDIAAPGVGVLSALPGGGYGELNGTSMAAPHVTGTVALMWSANPALKGNVARTAKILRRTAQPAALDSKASHCGNKENVVGAGIVDAYAAVRAAMKLRHHHPGR